MNWSSNSLRISSIKLANAQTKAIFWWNGEYNTTHFDETWTKPKWIPSQLSVPCYGMSTPTNNWAYRHLEMVLVTAKRTTIHFNVQNICKSKACKPRLLRVTNHIKSNGFTIEFNVDRAYSPRPAVGWAGLSRRPDGRGLGLLSTHLACGLGSFRNISSSPSNTE